MSGSASKACPRSSARARTVRGRALALLLAAGLFFALCPAAWAQSDTLTFGMSAAFNGPARSLGIEYYRGLMAAFEQVNGQGGAGGHRLALSLRDDGYNPTETLRNTIAFVEQERVFALLGYVGTPTTVRVLPLLKRYAASSVSLFFPLTGADMVYEGGGSGGVFTLRASYVQETQALVEGLLEAGRTRIAVFHQADAYGRSGWDGVRRALGARSMAIVAEATYPRRATFAQNFTREARIILAGRPEAVVAVGTAPACAAFVRDLRDTGFAGTVCVLSFADADNLAQKLLAQGQNAGRDYLRGLVFSQVVPCYEDEGLPAVRAYRAAMAKTQAALPASLSREDYVPHRLSFVSFEGYLAGMALAEALRRMPGEPSRAGLRQVMAGLGSLDLGLGARLDLRPGAAGQRRTYLTVCQGGRFRSVPDMKAALK